MGTTGDFRDGCGGGDSHGRDAPQRGRVRAESKLTRRDLEPPETANRKNATLPPPSGPEEASLVVYRSRLQGRRLAPREERRAGDQAGEGQDRQAPLGDRRNWRRANFAVDAAVTGIAQTRASRPTVAVAGACNARLAKRACWIVVVVGAAGVARHSDEPHEAGASVVHQARTVPVAVAGASARKSRGVDCAKNRQGT